MSPPQCRSQAVVCVSTPRMYPRSGYFLVITILSFLGSFNPEIIPKSFDARKKWPKCEKIISTVLDQGSCASSWAVAATSAMSDRLCINSPNNTVQKHVSARNLLNCCPNCGYKCDGGYPGMAWEYWHNTGIVTGNFIFDCEREKKSQAASA